jgi:hypothetical protein
MFKLLKLTVIFFIIFSLYDVSCEGSNVVHPQSLVLEKLNILADTVIHDKRINSLTVIKFERLNKEIDHSFSRDYFLGKHIKTLLGEKYESLVNVAEQQILSRENTKAAIAFLSQSIYAKEKKEFLLKLLFDKKYYRYYDDIILALGYFDVENIEDSLVYRLLHGSKTPRKLYYTSAAINKKRMDELELSYCSPEALNKDEWINKFLRVLFYRNSDFAVCYVRDGLETPGPDSQFTALIIALKNNLELKICTDLTLNLLPIEEKSEKNLGLKVNDVLLLLLEHKSYFSGNSIILKRLNDLLLLKDSSINETLLRKLLKEIS